jgi:hypothetical protein
MVIRIMAPESGGRGARTAKNLRFFGDHKKASRLARRVHFLFDRQDEAREG